MCYQRTGLFVRNQSEGFGILGSGCATHEVERIDIATKGKWAEVLAVVKHIAITLAVSLDPSLGHIGAQALYVDVIAIKAHLGNAHQGITLEPLIVIYIVTHVNARQQIRLSLQTLGHDNGIGIGSDVHLTVIHIVPANVVIIGILKDVAHLVLVQHEDVGAFVIIEYGINGHILAIHG